MAIELEIIFESLLDYVGLSRSGIYVTNSVLCNPKGRFGNNAPPSNQEIQNCVNFLRRQIDLINPKIVVTLGANALKATSLIEAHNLSLKINVRTESKWYGRKLIPLYHPGQRAMLHRSFANQRSDYQFVADTLRKLGHPFRKSTGVTKDSTKNLAESILKSKTEISYFALHKLAYLLEWEYAKSSGDLLTGAYFIRQKDGPYCTDLNLGKLKNTISDLQIINKNEKIYLRVKSNDLFTNVSNLDNNKISNYVNEKINHYLRKSDSELKTSAYMTRPMRDILVKERTLSINMYNSPINFFG